MKIRYYIDDGFVPARHREFEFPESEFAYAEDAQEAIDSVEEAIQEDFSQNVSPYLDRKGKEAVELAWTNLKGTAE